MAQPPQVPKGILPNPYTYTSATVAEAPPVRYTPEELAAREAQDRQRRNLLAFTPNQIRRPVAKNAPRPPGPPIMVRNPRSSSSSNPVPQTNAGTNADTNADNKVDAKVDAKADTNVDTKAPTEPVNKQLGVDYWRSTQDDDASILQDAKNKKKDWKLEQKKQKAFTKLHGEWYPVRPYKLNVSSNLRAYKADGGWLRAKESFVVFLQKNTAASDKSLPPTPENEASAQSPSASTAMKRTRSSSSEDDIRPADEMVPNKPYNPTISAPPDRFNYKGTWAKEDEHDEYDEYPSAKRPKLAREDHKNMMSHSNKPVYSSAAEKMMEKWGYIKGMGLGKNNDGIADALEHKPVVPGHNRIFNIVGGKRATEEPTQFGKMSDVVVAFGCVDGVDWAMDARRDDGGIRQDMGRTFNKKFGTIERIHVDLSSTSESKPIYIKFANQFSALNAVNRFSEGYQYNGQPIRAYYYSADKFAIGVYDAK